MSKGSTTTNTEINPELLAMYKEVYSGAKSASEIPFQPYTDPLVAGYSPDDVTAFDATRGMFGDSMGYNPRAELANMGGAPLDISPYMNPYQTEVIDRSIQDLDRARQLQIADSQDRAIGAGAFGGSRSAVLEADADRNVGAMNRQMQQAQLDANFSEFMRAQGYPDVQLDRLKSGVSFLPSSTNQTTRQKVGFGDILGAGAGLLGSAFAGGYFNKPGV